MNERGSLLLKILDRYAGIPLIFPLSRLKEREKSNLPSEVNNILVIKIGTIGDTLLSIPIFKAIKAKYPKAFLTVVGSKNNEEVLKRFSFIDSINIIEVSRLIKNPLYIYDFIKKLNQTENDIIIDLEPWARISALIASLVKGHLKIGFKTTNEYKHLCFDITVPHSAEVHEIENYVSLSESIGIEVRNRDLGFPISENEKVSVESFLAENKIRRFIVLHPWSSGYRGYLKEWGIKNSTNFANILIKEGYDVAVTGTNADIPKTHAIERYVPNRLFSVSGRFSLGETAYLIKKSSILVTVNTGVMHIGAALDHPMIALHGPAGVTRWGPIGSSRFSNIESKMDCAPCLYLGFEYKCRNGNCMDGIRPETVANKALEMLILNPA